MSGLASLTGCRSRVVDSEAKGWAQEQCREDSVENGGWEQEGAGEVSADFEVSEVAGCEEVIEEERPDGLGEDGFASRPTCNRHGEKGAATDSAYRFSSGGEFGGEEDAGYETRRCDDGYCGDQFKR